MKKLLLPILLAMACRLSFADTKISAMSSTTTLNAGDVIPVVANPSGTPTNNIITKANLSTTLDVLTNAAATITFASVGTSTSSLQTQVNNLNTSTATIATSTASLQTQVNSLNTSTATIATSTTSLQTQVNNLNTSTATIATSTASLQTQVDTLNTSTSTLKTQIETKVNYSSFSATSPITYNSATGAIGATQVSLSTQVTGTLPAANLVSTVAYTSIPNTFTSSQTISILQVSTINVTNHGAPPVAITYSPINVADNVNTSWGANMINNSTGTAASSYWSATSALGGPTSYYMTVGIVSPNFNQFGFSIVPGSAAFIYASDSNMEVAAGVNGTQGDLVFATGLPTSTNQRMSIGFNGAITTYSSMTFTGTVAISSGLVINGTVAALKDRAIGNSWDGGGSVLATGTTYWAVIPATGTIVKMVITGLASGSATVNVSSSTVFNTSRVSICASACPTLTSATISSDSTLTGWAKSLVKDGFLYFVVNTVSTISQLNVTLEYQTP